jgi:phosphatidylglycerol lysyltransferase
MALLSGAVLLISGATPTVPDRLDWLELLVPLPLLEASHFVGSLAGIGLLLLARGLQRRLDIAWWLTALLLIIGIVASLLKGVDYEEALILGVLLAGLLPARAVFYRKSTLLDEPFTAGWVVTIAVVLLSTFWLGLFSYKHVDYAHELWWQFSFDDTGDASRFLRAMVGVVTVALAFAAAKLLHPAPAKVALPGAADLDQARAVVVASSLTYPHLALLGDKALLFNPTRTAFLMYGVEGRTWVAMGDPVAATLPERRELAWTFRELCERQDGWTVFYQVHPNNLDLYVELGLTLLKIGEEARVPLAGFSLEGRNRKSLRGAVNRVSREGLRFEIIPASGVAALLPQLVAVSNAWLGGKTTREKGFSLGFFQADYLQRCPLAVVWQDNRLVAFANLWQGADREELSVDLMRYVPDTPAGLMDYLFVQLMLWGKAQGYRWFNLGMAPLAGLQSHRLAPLWNRFGALVFGHGERLYNFQGLHQYKDKFAPVWEPRYLAAQGGIALPRVLTDLTVLIAGGIGGVIQK